MRWSRSVLLFSIAAFVLAAGSAADAGVFGVGPGITGNDTGGIIPYSPLIAHTYPQMAAQYCASWGRLSRITSVRRRYGAYVAFVCIDKPWVIH